MAMPSGMTRTDLRRVMYLAAMIAHAATPTATTPCSMDALDRPRPSATSAHLMTMNCSVATGTPEQVVTASEIWPEPCRARAGPGNG